MRVSALFYVSKIVKTPTDYIEVTLTPVTRNVAKEPHSSANPSGGYESPNGGWAKYTPSGQITMTVSKETPAAEFFESNLGQDVPILFG